MAFSDNAFLAKLREHADRARRLFSNPQKSERERMLVRAFLRCVGDTFEDGEIIASSKEPIDVRFRNADFQIMEVVGNKRRGLEWRQRQDRYRDAQRVADVLEAYTPSQPLSFDDAAQLVADRLSAKAARYGTATCASLDALVYIDLHNRHLWPLESTGHGHAIAVLNPRLEIGLHALCALWRRAAGSADRSGGHQRESRKGSERMDRTRWAI